MKSIEKLFDKYGFWGCLVLSIYVVITVDLDLDRLKIPELFSDGHKFQNLFYQVALGTLVAMPLYYFVVHLPEKKHKDAFGTFLGVQLREFYEELERILIGMKSQLKYKYDHGLPTAQEIAKLFSESSPRQNGNAAKGDLMLWDEVIEFVEHYDEMINAIAVRSKNIDPELDLLLTRLYRCPAFNLARYHKSMMYDQPNLVAFGDRMYVSMQSIFNLSDYCNKEYGVEKIQDFLGKAN